MPIYPPPEENPKCVCLNPLLNFFCPWGHMLECHYPMGCSEAECGHWERDREVEQDSRTWGPSDDSEGP